MSPAATTLPTQRLRIGWSDHALERFCERAGVPERPRAQLEAELKRLVARDGSVVPDRPRWADSRNEADLFVQIGGWLLVVLMRDERGREGTYTAVTVLGREGWADWPAAHARGLTRVRPPRWARPSLVARLLRRLRRRG
ncbi:hypothetical protein AB0L40_17090 [Patulibacter sp. NPDC049589]|uniref:hypothetical protein n=1 Tax=Patulibacter sp. NPDC049589 TaxID=3154731 RepID=UPI00341E646B